MKQGAALNRVVILLIFFAILCYFGGAAWRAFHEPYPTVQVFACDLEDCSEVTGYLAREETILSGSGGIVRLLPGEGEKVAAGAVVAMLYRDQASVERSNRLAELQQEEVQLSRSLTSTNQSAPGEDGSGNIVESLAALRSAVESEDFSRLETLSQTFRSAISQQSWSASGTEGLESALITLRQEIAALQAQTAQTSGSVTVPESGIFSGQVDGYENVLTPDTLDTLKPSDLDTLESRIEAVDTKTLGKLITDSTWYFICALPTERTERLREGQTVTARFSRDWAGEVPMTIERVGSPEDGRAPVIFACDKYLSATTLLRRQTVELIFSSSSGIRIPVASVRMDEEGQSYVAVQVGVRSEFKYIRVLLQEDDYYLVEPLQKENATESQQKKLLRSGDRVIITAKELWDGKVLE